MRRLLIWESLALIRCIATIFGRKNRLQVDLGDLQNEKERLAKFLQSNLNISINPQKDKLVFDSENLSALELQKAVVKYVHSHNLSRGYWVSVEGKTVKFNRFRGAKKKEKQRKGGASQSLTQSWGL